MFTHLQLPVYDLNALNDVIDFATEFLFLSINHLAKLDTVNLIYAELLIKIMA